MEGEYREVRELTKRNLLLQVGGGDMVREPLRGSQVEAEMWSVHRKCKGCWGRKNVSTQRTVYARALRTGNIAWGKN